MPLFPARFSDTADGLVPAPNSGGATNFLREDGTWQAAGGAGSTGSLVYLEHQDASASAQIDFALDAYTGYDSFLVVISKASPATDLVEFQMRTSTDSGSTFDSGASDYRWANHAYTSSAGNAVQGSAADTRICLTDNGNDMGNLSAEAWSGQVWVYRPAQAAPCHIEFRGQYRRGSDGLIFGVTGMGAREASADVTDIRFLMSSGNIGSGRFTLYGLSLTSEPGGVPTAADIDFTPANDVSATDVQAAIEELANEADVLNSNEVFQIVTDCVAMPASTGQYAGDFGVQFSGTGTQVISATTDVGQSARIGIMQLESGTTATGRAAIRTNVDSIVAGGGELIYEADVRIENLSDATNEYDFRVGFGDSDTGDHADGMYFEYDRNTRTNWSIVCAGASTRTRNDSGTACNADQWYKLRIVCNAAANSVSFFIDGTETSNSPITGANIPSGFAERFGAGAWLVKSAGTTERLAYVDRIMVKKTLTTPR